MPRCFSLHTDTFELVWSTRREQRSGVPLQVEVLEGDGVRLDVPDDAAVLQEETTYTVLVKSQAPVVLAHRHPGFFGGISTTDGERIAHGTVNFGSQVGYSDVTVLVGGAAACTFRMEVYPSKIDYQRDYVALRDAVGSLHADLALGYLQRTYQLGRVGATRGNGLLGWLFVLRGLVDDLAAAVQHIARQPYRRAASISVSVAPEQVRSNSAQAMLPADLLRLPKHDAGHGIRVHIRRRQRTSRLWEHAWLHNQLTTFARRLSDTEHDTRHGSTPREHAIHDEINRLKSRLTDLAGALPTGLKQASTSQPQQPSALFERAPGYREAYQLCTLLQHSLDLQGGPIPFEVKDIHQLYEYWCYLMTVEATAKILGVDMPISQLIALRDDRLPVRLWQGTQQALTFDLGAQGTLTLAYNPRYSGPAYLVPQQPDIVLTLQPRSGPARRFILDAKYRLDTSPGYIRRYGAPGPPRDALNDLHRYRDAIREHDGVSAHVEHAIVLFPYHNTPEHDFTTSRLWHAIDAKGIGALPVLPNNTVHLEQWLTQVLTVNLG
ncbi:MAG: DUF2357 domain-containing protein [Bacteroidota bacterium]